jgi:hypothetical protein
VTKRADGKFRRKERDSYDTPAEAVRPLIRHLRSDGHRKVRFYEPCAGAGKLTEALIKTGCCLVVGESDIEPRSLHVKPLNAFHVGEADIEGATHFITNPPWDRKILHPLVEKLSMMRPTWLLLDADWMHTKQAIPYLEHCIKIVSVGRVSWMANNVSGFDNCCWYLFDWKHSTSLSATLFYGRLP